MKVASALQYPQAKYLQEEVRSKFKNVHLLCIPAHTSHILQLMDVGIYGPMKATWKKVLKYYKTNTRAVNMTKGIFPHLLDQLWTKSIMPEHIKSGFCACGLYPLNPAAIHKYKIAPSIAVENCEFNKKSLARNLKR